MTTNSLKTHAYQAITTISIVVLTLSTASGQTFSKETFEINRNIYDAILNHPFLKEMQDGSLDREIFGAYLVQDAHFLRGFAQALRITASKAPKSEWAQFLQKDADTAMTEERRLHDSVLGTYGISSEEVAQTELSPAAFAYVNYLLTTAHERPFSEAIAALLPCYWLYWEIGKALAEDGSPEPTYQQWIDTYSSKSYGSTVETILAMTDEIANQEDQKTRLAMQKHFSLGSRYEWMFWDAAYHKRGWPLQGMKKSTE
jgi:thiaminase/transcriptional activator TenA